MRETEEVHMERERARERQRETKTWRQIQRTRRRSCLVASMYTNLA